MLRTADAAGAEAVIAADPVTDWGNPNLVRASKGTVFSVPVASDSTEATLQWLRDHDIALVATTPDTDLDYTDVDYTGPVASRRRRREVRPDRRGPRRRPAQGPHPDGRAGNSLNVATSAAIVDLRGGPPAPSRLTRRPRPAAPGARPRP